jgi:electron transport complex protein RnfC
MSMHSGKAANPVVNTGDYVQAGQVIGEAGGTDSPPVHASVSGRVKSIDYIDSLTGEKTVTVTIASDAKQTLWEGIKPPRVTNLDEFLDAVINSGAVEPGGAGYPAAQELRLKDYSKLDYILVYGAGSEPYITSDAGTMIDDAEYVREGMRLLKEYLRPKNDVVCIENNKPYPQGHRRILAYSATGRIVPEGGSLSDTGCIVLNCTTLASIAKFIKTGHPFISRYVTVAGSAVKSPKNVIAPIGTPVRELFTYCDGLKDEVKKIILGGPITGLAIPNMEIPIVKATTAVLAFWGKDAGPPIVSACIKCGRCAAICPMRLMPPYIENAFELKKTELLRKFKADICAECGCCAYVCPAKRPLLQLMTLSKKMLGKKEAK